jgi:hypothetical protein
MEAVEAYEALIYADDVHPFEIGQVSSSSPPMRETFRIDKKTGRITASNKRFNPDALKPKPPSKAWLVSLKNDWFRCDVAHRDGPFYIRNAVDGVLGGMPGSPIVDDQGRAVGAVSTGGGIVTKGGRGIGKITDGPMNPNLALAMPGWMLVRPSGRAR